LKVVVSGLPTAFVHLLSAYCDELATGFFLHEMTEISAAVSAKSNEPYTYRFFQRRFLCLFTLVVR
jgi:hypothetical protein